MYRFAICDDEQADIAYVTDMVKSWGKERGHQVEIQAFSSAESFLFAYEEEKDFDILFLDIEMGKMNGVELAKKIREQDKSIQLIFITGYMEYISEGYDVEALHYLLKPVTMEKLKPVLDRAVQRILVREKTLVLRLSEGTVRVPLYEVKWLEVQKNYVTIYGKEVYSVKQTLSEIRKELDGRFFQSHRSYIINLSYVKKITKNEVVLKDGTQIPLARGLYDQINQAFIKYF